MKSCIHINFDGKLIGKGRPRFGKGHAYTPAKTRAAESSLAWKAKIAMQQANLHPFQGPVKLYCNILIAYPRSWTKKRKIEAGPYYTGKPDADNQLKLLDSLNGIVWRDDSQIAIIDFQRTWWPTSHVHIRVDEL